MSPYSSPFLSSFVFVFILNITQACGGPIASAVCSNAVFSSLNCLSDSSLARTACRSVLGVEKITTTLSTTTISYTTVTATAHAHSQTTAVSVNSNDAAATETVTVNSTATTNRGTSTKYMITTYTKYFTTTTTIYGNVTSTLAPAKRETLCLTALDPLLSSLSSLGSSSGGTACSCLGFLKETKTLTATETFASPATTTVQAGTAPTTTIVSLAVPTETLTAMTTATQRTATTVFTLSTTTSITETSTLSLAAPTYTRVYGPATGCSNDSPVGSQNLESCITDGGIAVQQCKDICSQHGNCSSLFVQRMFAAYGSNLPFWACYWNDHPLKESDLVCGRNNFIFGTAMGFDAVGRGTA